MNLNSTIQPMLATQLQATLDRWQLFAPSLGANVTIGDARYGVWHGASGYADADTKTPMPVSAKCYIYSITKTFTAVRVLQLAETAALALDEPISRYLDDVKLPDGVTVRRLLDHTAGVPSYTELSDYVPANRASPSQPWSYEYVRDRTCTGALDFEPGTSWHYSNTGYMLLARLIDRVTGESYAANIGKDIAGPLDLRSTYVADNVDTGDLTPGYSRELSADDAIENIVPRYHPWWCRTGLIVSTTAETAAFFEALFDGALTSAESFAQMRRWTSAGEPGDPFAFFRRPGYGLGLMIDPEWPHGALYGHGGGGPGFNTWAMVVPEFYGRRLVLVVFCNTSIGSQPFKLVQDLVRTLRAAS
jgi:D-alanyl-D-alanine carboxypeptidase